VLLFGGLTSAGASNETWAWDGSTWALLGTTGPSARYGHTMAYDPARDRVVLHGGRVAGGGQPYLNDTWTHNGTAWQQQNPSTITDRARMSHGLTYDAGNRTVVLFGGAFSSETNDTTWSWNGTTWHQPFFDPSPAARAQHVLAYDAIRNDVVIHGGATDAFYDAVGDTWSLQWRAHTPGESCRFGFDGDGDNLRACADPDCAGLCDPLCAMLETCTSPSRPRCGDGSCSSLESYRLCPADCMTPPNVCGDFSCDAGENATTCPGDCP
jgi:hypothetical protein